MTENRYTRARVDPYASFQVVKNTKNRVVITVTILIVVMALFIFSLGTITVASYVRDGIKGRN